MASSASGTQVRASHILIKHEGSRRKASWKDPEGRVIKNTTRDSAISQLKAIREDIVSGKAKFEDVASRISDCSSAKRGGDLGKFATDCREEERAGKGAGKGSAIEAQEACYER
ncbi:peptidyl-prolyl cis-trans isomerase Pin1 [Populus alba x Populus x berolinensis]|nr:peptidyl-prolyl cis-trans isomerase Pin1 [Populus alba x Populus x berolinensis]